MKLNDYQKKAQTTLMEDRECHEYLLIGLAGEVGEVMELFKKSMWHGSDIERNRVKEELGDVLWYLSQIAGLSGFSLQEIAEHNLRKLQARYR